MAEADVPRVTVIAPCRNEAGFIRKAISTILANDYPAESIELLVVDGMSTDGTREIVREMAEQDNRIRLLDNPKRIVPSAMNIGIRAACGDYIARIDCHSVFASDYISKSIEVSRRTGADGVGGYMKTLPVNETAVATAIAAAMSCTFGVGNSAFRTGGPEQEVDAMPFGTVKKEIFSRVGMFDERLVRNQDIELYGRIREAGGRIVISPEIKLSYYSRATYRGLWQQSFNNGLWNLYTVWLTGGGLSLRHFVPMFFVFGLFTFGAGAFFWRPLVWVLLAYAGLYLSVAGGVSVMSSWKTKSYAVLVFWAFVVLHVAYGVGSLWSIITIPFKFRKGTISSINVEDAGR